MMHRSAQKSYGFTLAEVLLAVLFVSIAFFGFTSLQQRIIYSTWKTELRNEPRERCRSQLVNLQSAVREDGGNDKLEKVPGVNDGLYIVRSQHKWTDKSAAQAGGDTREQTYQFETYAVQRRVKGW